MAKTKEDQALLEEILAEIKDKETKGEFQPTKAGNTGTVYSKKGLALKELKRRKHQAALNKWEKKKDAKVKLLVSVGGVFQDHPDEKTFGGGEGQIIRVKEDDAELLINAGHAEAVSA